MLSAFRNSDNTFITRKQRSVKESPSQQLPQRLHAIPLRLDEEGDHPVPGDVHQATFVIQDSVVDGGPAYAGRLRAGRGAP